MDINNKLDYSFGVTGVYAGYLLFIAGVFLINKAGGVFMIILGAFMAFSFSGVSINVESNTVFFYNKFFGLFRAGKKRRISDFKLITVAKAKRSSRTFSSGNRPLILSNTDYRIYLINPEMKERLAIKKCKTKEIAHHEASELSRILNLTILEH